MHKNLFKTFFKEIIIIISTLEEMKVNTFDIIYKISSKANDARKTMLEVNIVVAFDFWRSFLVKLSTLQASSAKVFWRDRSFWQVLGSKRHSYSFFSPTLAGEHLRFHAAMSHCKWLTLTLQKRKGVPFEISTTLSWTCTK